MEEKDNLQLPENAFRELKDGEEYKPLMSPDKVYPEVNGWSVTWGIVMAVIFSAAAAYLGLKVGQVFEAAIPIAIIAVGVSTATKRSKALGENVIIQSIGACSGAVVAGAIFTLPAIYILQAKYPEMTTSFMKIFMASALGGVLGILFLIPFRKHLRLEVWDEGIGISAQEQTKVFTRFYRSPQANGTESNGIGLSLTRDLVYLHHGTLDLQSTPGKGSRFTIDLPLEETAYQPEEICQPPMVNHPDTDTTRPSTDGLAHSPSARLCPTILIVDDNAEITDSIGRLIGQRYHIITAHDARLAFSRLQDQNIDLMVCDLKMPGTDGLTLCREVKNDLSTSHIPVIILTAQATDDTHAACYEAGADGYLTKPFDIRVLTTRIDNLLLQYRQRSRQFLHAPDTDCDVLPYQNRDKTFLENMVKTVESHFTDSDFNLDCLAAEAKLSKSTMNRKLKAMTGLTPMDFVKNIRLRSACRLLRQADMTVSEVAYAVGFNDPKYFAKCFKEEYGQTPSQFQDRPDMGNRA